MQVSMFAQKAGKAILASSILLALSLPAQANKELDALSKQNTNWVMQTKDYSSTHFSDMYDINVNNVKNLKVAWSFSTGGGKPKTRMMMSSDISQDEMRDLALSNPDVRKEVAGKKILKIIAVPGRLINIVTSP